jgi:hypothetical protein
MTELMHDYLLGTWCKQSGQEDGPWEFAEVGSYQGGMPDSVRGYVMHPLGDSIEHFCDRWHRLESKSDDQFVVYPSRSDTRRTVFSRNDCDQPETLETAMRDSERYLGKGSISSSSVSASTTSSAATAMLSTTPS